MSSYSDQARWYINAMADAKTAEERVAIHDVWAALREAERPHRMPARIRLSIPDAAFADSHPDDCQCCFACQVMHPKPAANKRKAGE